MHALFEGCLLQLSMKFVYFVQLAACTNFVVPSTRKDVRVIGRWRRQSLLRGALLGAQRMDRSLGSGGLGCEF